MKIDELMSVPLKRCPFCNALASLHWYNSGTVYMAWVECRMCRAQTEQKVVAAESIEHLEEAKCQAVSSAIGGWNIRNSEVE